MSNYTITTDSSWSSGANYTINITFNVEVNNWSFQLLIDKSCSISWLSNAKYSQFDTTSYKKFKVTPLSWNNQTTAVTVSFGVSGSIFRTRIMHITYDLFYILNI